MKLMYVYILQCSDNSFYTGVTNNLERRIREHSEGLSKEAYTFSRRPVKLVFYEKCQSPLQAIALEKKIKGWSRKKKLALINSDWKNLHEYAKCKNATSHTNYKQ